MYCMHCNAYNDDNSRYCSNCGADLSAQAQQAADAQQGSYTQPPYQQPYGQSYGQPNPGYAPQELTRPLTIALPIVSLIIGIVFGNLIGILLGTFSLVNFNRYTAALNAHDIPGAEVFKKKSKQLGVAGIVVSVAFLVLAMMAFVIFASIGIANFAFMDDPLVQFNFEDVPESIPALLSLLSF